MNVAIDSGNSYSKVGWFEQNRLVRYQAGLKFEDMVEAVRSGPVAAMIFSSVGVSIDKFTEALQPQVPVLHLTAETPLPVAVSYHSRSTLGVDRLAAAVGGNRLFPGEDLVIIDAGTCVTYDLIDKKAVFQGGIIAPGMRMRFEAMHRFTQRLPLVSETDDPPLIGKSTAEAMQSGVVNGMKAEMEGIIEEYRNVFPGARVLLCGGDAAFFESRLKLAIFAVPELVLIGLNRILQYNVLDT